MNGVTAAVAMVGRSVRGPHEPSQARVVGAAAPLIARQTTNPPSIATYGTVLSAGRRARSSSGRGNTSAKSISPAHRSR